MKYREEPSNDSTRGEWSARQTDSVSRPGRTGSASFEQPALSRHSAVSGVFPEMLMEAVVSRSNMERAWERVRSNRGAPGPDGITVDEFIEWARPQWESIVQQLLDGTYRPGPVRRVTIAKPDGGERQLAAYSWKRAKRA
jgi:RNA-directed DNA polymerase